RRSGSAGFAPSDLHELREAARAAPSVSQLDLVTGVSAVLPVVTSEGEIAVVDCGAKWNILRSLERRGVRLRVYPWNASASEILSSQPRGILISNGPGDPAKLPTVVDELRTLVSSGTPVLGICLGHQLLGLAAGATTNRLPYGHHGGNHPVRDLASGRVPITTRNPERGTPLKVLIIGSGPIVIGQAAEFDYAGTQACRALREEGHTTVLVNSNPATIMTDPGVADRTYVEPLTAEFLELVIDRERPEALLPGLGGQTALNLAVELADRGILDRYQVQN